MSLTSVRGTVNLAELIQRTEILQGGFAYDGSAIRFETVDADQRGIAKGHRSRKS